MTKESCQAAVNQLYQSLRLVTQQIFVKINVFGIFSTAYQSCIQFHNLDLCIHAVDDVRYIDHYYVACVPGTLHIQFI